MRYHAAHATETENCSMLSNAVWLVPLAVCLVYLAHANQRLLRRPLPQACGVVGGLLLLLALACADSWPAALQTLALTMVTGIVLPLLALARP